MSIGLSKEELEKLLRHLNEKWANKNCPMCRQNQWSVTGAHTVILQEEENVFNLGGPSIPTAAVTCLSCGNILFINLIVARVYGGSQGG